MPAEWAEVETLIRDLGAVCFDATVARPSHEDTVTIKRAIGQATQAIIDIPGSAEGISNARQAIATARELVAGLAVEIERGRRAREHAAELGVKPRPRRDGD